MGGKVCWGVIVVIPGVAVHPQAARDAEEIYAYLAKHNLDVARRFNAAVADSAVAILGAPHLGIAWQARGARLTNLRWKRVRGFKKYLIFYRVENNCVVLVRILHGARDIETLLEEGYGADDR